MTVADALASFRTGDVSVLNHLAIEFSLVDTADLVRLQERARSSPPGDASAVEALDALLPAEDRSAVVLDMLASAWAAAGRPEMALQRRLEALPVTARWDPELAGRVLNNVAWALVVLDRPAEALLLAQEGLRFDPFSPFTIGTAVDAARRVGDDAWADQCERYLLAQGYDDPFVPAGRPLADGAAYSPGSRPAVELSDVEIFRLIVANRHDRNRPKAAALLSLALALAAAGRPGPAYFAATVAPEADDHARARHVADARDGIGAGLPAQVRAGIDAGAGRFARKRGKRIRAVADLCASGDVAALWDMVFDPDIGVCLTACQALATLGVREELLPLVELLDDLEERTGTRIYHDGAPKPYALLPVLRREPVDLRGEALVEAVIERNRAGTGELKIARPEPLPNDLLATLTFPNGMPLPPSLRRWLAFDAEWLAQATDFWGGLSDPVFRTCTVAEAVRDTIDPEVFWAEFRRLERYADAQVLPLDAGSETVRFLLLVDPDEHGEYPVFNADIDDEPCIYLVELGFDTWLAGLDGLIADTSVVYEAAFEDADARLQHPDHGIGIAWD